MEGIMIDEKEDKLEGMDLDLLADNIVAVGNAAKRMKGSRLTKRAIVTLIQDSAGAGRLTRWQIELVLESAERLPDIYLKKNKRKKNK
jgi:hypothetical protein